MIQAKYLLNGIAHSVAARRRPIGIIQSFMQASLVLEPFGPDKRDKKVNK
jgi:hypothetical protein